MAQDSATSFGYARSGSAWPKSRFVGGGYAGNILQCIAIAEVPFHPFSQVRQHMNHGFPLGG